MLTDCHMLDTLPTNCEAQYSTKYYRLTWKDWRPAETSDESATSSEPHSIIDDLHRNLSSTHTYVHHVHVYYFTATIPNVSGQNLHVITGLGTPALACAIYDLCFHCTGCQFQAPFQTRPAHIHISIRPSTPGL